jgi:muramoyltetrapeptide carboxypeptidase
MNRKHFLKASSLLIGSTAVSFKGFASAPAAEEVPVRYKIPPYLQKGDVIGVTSPAGFISVEEIQPAMQVMQGWGYQIKVGATIGKKDFTFGGTDEERLQDFQSMLDDPQVNAIMCARGGYGSIRIVDQINWTTFKKHPKWVIGFSDITVLHSHIHANCGAASIHSKMTNSFPEEWTNAEPIQLATIESINFALTGKPMFYEAMSQVQNKPGKVEGILIGGNLKTIETLSCSRSDISTNGKILFVEDTGEYLYSIDRMFWNLKRTGKLQQLKGLIVGGFRIKADDPGEEFGRTLQEIVLEKIKDCNYPVCFDFPVGHQKNNFALKCGVKHQLAVSPGAVYLKEVQ